MPLRTLSLILLLWVAVRIVIANEWVGLKRDAPAIAAIPQSLRAFPSPIAPSLIAETYFPPEQAKVWKRHRVTRQALPNLLSVHAAMRPPKIAPLAAAHEAVLPNDRIPVMTFAAAPPRDTARPDLIALPSRSANAQPIKLEGSAWSALRGGRSRSLGSNGSLGGSEVGARVYWPVSHAISITGRVSAALEQPGKEVSAGLSWKLPHLPARIIAERRIGVDSAGRDAMALTLVAGLYGKSLPHGLTLDGYAQTGFVGLKSRDAFVDGSATISKAITRGAAKVSIGAGIWGGAQPGLERVDMGPVARLQVRHIEASLSWRQRVVGDAAPASGPALTLGTNF